MSFAALFGLLMIAGGLALLAALALLVARRDQDANGGAA